jgi:hypothetical protein
VAAGLLPVAFVEITRHTESMTRKMCAQTLVLVVESELYGGYVPLTEGTLDKLRSMDQWTKFKSAEAMQRH